MSKSTTNSRTTRAARGEGEVSQQPASGPTVKPHQVIPEADFGGDDDEEDDYQPPTRAFTPRPAVSQTPAAVVPAQVTEPTEGVKAASPQVITAESSTSPATQPEAADVEAPADVETVADTATEIRATAQGSPATATSPAPQTLAKPDTRNADLADESADLPAASGALVDTDERTTSIQVESNAVVDVTPQAPDVPTWTPRYAPAVRTSGSVSVAAPARRPGRRRPIESFDAERPRQRNQEAGQELAMRAPRYAALLGVYSGGQLATLQFESRNVNLYGLLADQVGAQVVADKALLKKLTNQRPRLTPAHYVDAALEPVLRPLDPEGTDLDNLEAEREYVWDLAQRGNAYRKYIKSDQDSDSLPHYRAKIPLRADVNARFSRLIDVMDSMQGVPAKPYEIVSAVLAEYLIGLTGEVPALTEVFGKYTEVTTIQ
ncbi:hypothetical protein ACPC54_19245 [Kitasatospora sp. NPDC094028]